ncbi:MAG: MBL fold metallo-hydrolase [Dehalococcoidia bacterium]|nr:MBL fold metallo-hydrolase [Dehalococcoidia bacterium]
MIDNIIALGFAPEKLSFIIATHRHIDHMRLLGEVTQTKQSLHFKN